MYAHSPFIANQDNSAAIFHKTIQWISQTGSQFLVSSSCTNPILMTYQSLTNTNCWMMIHYSREDHALCFTVSNGLAIPPAKLPLVLDFLEAINRHSPYKLEFDYKDNAIWAGLFSQLTDAELQDEDIEGPFNVACKMIDDSTVPLLTMIYGNTLLADAVTSYEKALKISPTNWRSSIEPWQSKRKAMDTRH